MEADAGEDVPWKKKLSVISVVLAGIACLCFMGLHRKWDGLNILIGIVLIMLLPKILYFNIAVGVTAFFYRHMNKLYHCVMAVLVFFWLVVSVFLTLLSTPTRCTTTFEDKDRAWLNFQYLKQLHHSILEKLSHHLLQLSESNTKNKLVQDVASNVAGSGADSS